MKKIIFVITIFLMIMPVFAKEYTVQEDVVSVNLDDTWLVITKDNYKNNSSLKDLCISEYYEKEFGKEFENNDVYFNALKSDKGYIIYDLIISYYEENRLKNYINYDEDFLWDDSKVLKKNFKDKYKVLDNGIYINDNTKYIWVNYYYDQHYYQYYETIVNEKTYQIYMASGKIDKNEIENFRKNIIDNITFNIDSTLVEDDYSNDSDNNIITDIVHRTIFDTLRDVIIFFVPLTILSVFFKKKLDKKEKIKESDEFWE